MNTTNSLKSNTLSAAEITFLVVATVSPMVVTFGFFTLAIYYGSIGFLGLFVFIVPLWIIYAVGYTAMARYVRNTGAFYAFISQGIGRPLGIASSYVAAFCYTGFLCGNVAFIGYSMNHMLSTLWGVNIAWWIYSFIAIAIIGFIGYRNIELGARVLIILMSIEVALLLLISFFAFLNPAPGGFDLDAYSLKTLFSGNYGLSIMFAFACFTGVEATAIFSEEAKNPRRTVPIATYASILFLGILYIIVGFGLVAGWGVDGLLNELVNGFERGGDPHGIFNKLADRVLGGWSGLLLQIILTTSIFAAALNDHNITSRYFFSSGRTRILPSVLGKSHPKYKSPHIGSLIETGIVTLVIIITAIVGMKPFEGAFAWYQGIGIMGFVTLYTVTGIAVIMFFSKNKTLESSMWKTKIAPVISAIGFIYGTVMIYINYDLLFGEENKGIAYGLMALILSVAVIGVIVGYWLRRNRPEVYKQVGKTVPEKEEDSIEDTA